MALAQRSVAEAAQNHWREALTIPLRLLLQRRLAPFALAAICLIVAVAFQWRGPNSIAVADGISYIASGLSLMRNGSLTNPFGEPEVWFPPFYPFLIGLFSLNGNIDPVWAARAISLVCALLSLYLVLRTSEVIEPRSGLLLFLAPLVLAASPVFQQYGNAVMSESLATALNLLAFVCWMRLPRDCRRIDLLLVGVFVGLSYLTRPEALILIPAWAAIDACHFGARQGVRRLGLMCAAASLLVVPYSTYLYSMTGQLALSGKAEVNLAGGRSEYYGCPREYINPATLDMEYYPCTVTLGQEASRIATNLKRIVSDYTEMFRYGIGAAIPIAGAIGALVLIRGKQWRVLLSLVATCAYLLVIPLFSVGTRFLHATLPAVSVLAAMGFREILLGLRLPGRGLCRQLMLVAFLAWALFGIAEGATRQPRWAFQQGPGRALLLRQAGLKMKEAGFPVGVMYEDGASTGYYAGQMRRRLIRGTPLGTLVQFIKKHEAGHMPVWLVLRSGEEYQASLGQMLSHDSSAFEKALSIRDDHEEVTVYRYRR